MTGSAWTPMSVFNARIVNNGSCCISPRISDQSSANDNTQRLATTETTEQHGNFNLFHFQNDQMWPVNMTGKTKGWPVNSQISPDIVRWPAVISSPAILNNILLFSLRFINFFHHFHERPKRNLFANPLPPPKSVWIGKQ